MPGLGGRDSVASAMNDGGQVVGFAYLPDETYHAFLWQPGDDHATDLGTLGGDYSQANAVSDNGQVVGDSTLDDGRSGVFLWADGQIHDLALDGQYVTARAVNDVGQVVVLTHAGPDVDALVWEDDDTTRIDFGGSNVTPSDINEGGLVVGYTQPRAEDDESRPGPQHAFAWTPDHAMDLGTLGHDPDAVSFAASVNEAGAVVGYSSTDGGSQHAFLWTDGQGMRDLGTLGQDSRASSVSNEGVVVGSSTLPSGGSRAFLWRDGEDMQSLGTLGGGSSEAAAISPDGDTVVGESETADGDTHAFSWTASSGMVDLGPLVGGEGYALSVDDAGLALGNSRDDATGEQRATVWDTTAATPPEAPGRPRGVTAAAGDGSVSVGWSPPSSNGQSDITSYTVTASPGGVSRTVDATTDGSPNTATFSGLTNGTAYSFTVRAHNAQGDGPESDPSDAVTPQTGASPPVVVTGMATPSSGGTVSTGDGNADEENPVLTTVSVPRGTSGGQVSISQGVRDNPPPTGFTFLGQQVVITAPSSDADRPLRLIFRVDASVLGGVAPSALQIFRTEGNGAPTQVPDCVNQDGTANPDPCVTNRSDLGDGDVYIEVLSSHASDWNFARKNAAPPPQTYPFRGFLAPYKNPPKVNTVKAGSTLPLKFSLHGNRGLKVIASGFPQSAKVSCSKPTSILGSAATTSGNLSYARKTDTYTYALKSAKSYAGTCRAVQVRLKDGSRHNALFRFTK